MPKKYKYKRTIEYDSKRYWIYADTLEELGRKKILKLQELEKKQSRDKHLLVADYIPRCIDTYKQGQQEKTRKEYKQILNRGITAHIGDVPLVKVTPELCQNVLNMQSGKSKTQINYIYQGLKFIFSHALAEGYILENPTLLLKKPKGTYHPRRALTPLERETLINAASKERKYYCFLLMLFCGCRPSEACSCKGSDISVNDDGTPILHIRGTKTKNADRYVPIPKILYKLIKKTKKNELISVYPSGLPIADKNNRTKLWRGLWYKMNLQAGTKTYRNKLIEPYQIPKDLTPYCLRHEFCSELARKGVDIRIAQKLMGHASINLTANIYTHIEDKIAVSNVAKLIDE